MHHGIYVGQGKVVHCGAVSAFVPRGPVEEGLPVRFTAQEVIERARSRTGADSYPLFTNNCEHFCEWCLRGRHRSYQVERLARWLRPWLPMSMRLKGGSALGLESAHPSDS